MNPYGVNLNNSGHINVDARVASRSHAASGNVIPGVRRQGAFNGPALNNDAVVAGRHFNNGDSIGGARRITSSSTLDTNPIKTFNMRINTIVDPRGRDPRFGPGPARAPNTPFVGGPGPAHAPNTPFVGGPGPAYPPNTPFVGGPGPAYPPGDSSYYSSPYNYSNPSYGCQSKCIGSPCAPKCDPPRFPPPPIGSPPIVSLPGPVLSLPGPVLTQPGPTDPFNRGPYDPSNRGPYDPSNCRIPYNNCYNGGCGPQSYNGGCGQQLYNRC